VTLDEPDDAELVIAARAGDGEAFADLYRRFGRHVHGLLLARMGPDDAADVAQEVFARAWKRLGRLREPAAFGSWIAAIARRSAADHLRSRRPHARLDPALAAPETQSASVRAREALGAIRELPEAYRETLILRLVEGLSGPEIAALTGLTPDSVRVNLHRGFKLLRQRLGAHR
jgi:RNA polymerase sigma-70 factor, ECF subfamily